MRCPDDAYDCGQQFMPHNRAECLRNKPARGSSEHSARLGNSHGCVAFAVFAPHKRHDGKFFFPYEKLYSGTRARNYLLWNRAYAEKRKPRIFLQCAGRTFSGTFRKVQGGIRRKIRSYKREQRRNNALFLFRMPRAQNSLHPGRMFFLSAPLPGRTARPAGIVLRCVKMFAMCMGGGTTHLHSLPDRRLLPLKKFYSDGTANGCN